MQDDVDAETLQAQVNMAMSFAHNLVTSWIKPCHSAQLWSTAVDATQTLEEELRRPPRLGVGAPLPTTPLMAHEASKLKRRLEKQSANSHDAMKLQAQGSAKSDDEEYKGRPAKRKTKVDPFGHGNKKKRKHHPGVKLYSSAESDSKHSALNDPSRGMFPTQNPLLKKEQGRVGSSGERSIVPSVSRGISAIRAPASGATNTEPVGAHADTTLALVKAKPPNAPLLNLGSPPDSTDKPGNRKRNRHKKKRIKIAGTGDYSH